jgi:hypothetical protein
MTMIISRGFMLAMTGCKIPWEISCARMNGECGDVVSRVEACAASPDDGLVRPFGDIDVATAGILLNSFERD